jgi:3-hydroxyisobutyrate dehydrogenase-like beta-hydroxyacid dehydrogenase
MRVTVIGVGKMGLQMARHLAAAGHVVAVYDNSVKAQVDAQAAGLVVSSDLLSALERAEVVLSSLPHDSALLEVGAAVVAHANEQAIYVDTSTVSMHASATIAQQCASRGIAHVRATVSGNNKMAEQAQLTILGSGPKSAYERVLPLLQLFGPSQFYLGDGDQARLMKLVINLMIASTSAMLAEALALGEKGGLEWRKMWDVITASAVGSPIIRAKAVQLRERDYTPTFTVDQMRKDVGLILEAGSLLNVPMALTSVVDQMLVAASAQGDANLDYAAVIRAKARASGLPADRSSSDTPA